jgi:hypothetical protein
LSPSLSKYSPAPAGGLVTQQSLAEFAGELLVEVGREAIQLKGAVPLPSKGFAVAGPLAGQS